jgi:hypothetical protein
MARISKTLPSPETVKHFRQTGSTTPGGRHFQVSGHPREEDGFFHVGKRSHRLEALVRSGWISTGIDAISVSRCA